MESSRLRWQCRRGMRELDQLLVRYLEQHYETADEIEKAAFEAFLSLPDPQLMRYLLSKEPPAPEFVIVVGHILDRTDA